VWDWLQRLLQTEDPLEGQIRDFEKKLNGRLNYIDVQLERLQRFDRRWDPHITLVGEDILPMGNKTLILSKLDPWWSKLRWVAPLLGALFVGAALAWLLA